MAMKCPKCGSEISPDEAFCGQCGTPTTALGQATEMMQSPRSGPLNTNVYGPNRASMPAPPQMNNRSGMLPSQDAYGTAPIASAQGGQAASNAPAIRPAGPPQSPGFYQDATEAMSSWQGTPGQSYAPGYPPQSYNGLPAQGVYPPGNAPAQPFQSGNFPQSGPGYSPAPFPPAQTPGGYGMHPQTTPPPRKDSGHSLLIVATVLLVVALIVVSILGTVYFLNKRSPRASAPPTATSAPSPTTAPSPSPTPSPTPSPSPTTAPTPTPFSGFAWCGSQCTTNGFAVQYPQGWNLSASTGQTSIQFLNPSALDEYATFRTPGATSNTADTLVSSDLQANYATQPGYTPPTSTLTTTIGGVTWVYQTADYQYQANNLNQPEQINVYATVYQGKGYIIELQAATSQFSAVNTQFFATIIGSFEFSQSTG